MERVTTRFRTAVRGLPSLAFFLGIGFGFAGCIVAGRIVSQRPVFENFVRFFEPIQPQRFFYPTISQLCAQVRQAAAGGRTPVIVGGASYFRGTGQNPDELWTLELQRLLGVRYVVVNLAIDQAEITSFAGVVFKVLAREFPEALYVANGDALSGASWDGGDVYGYLFWDAFYKGLLPASVADKGNLREFARGQRRDPAKLEMHLGKWIDARVYACDLWTYIGYKHFFTVWSDGQASTPFAARRRARESIDPNIRQAQLAVRRDAAYTQHSENFGKNQSRARFIEKPPGTWQPDVQAWNHLAEEWRELFPPELRPRCFVVLLRGNPYFMQTLTPEERRRTELQYQLGQRNLEQEGYRVVQLRPEEFDADDFLDGGHYVASGGKKIARAVAGQIAAAAQEDRKGATPAVRN